MSSSRTVGRATRGDTASRISREALRLFARDGYGATTVAAIEASVGLSPGSGGMYRHYESKEDVLRAAVDGYEARFAERVASMADELSKVDRNDRRAQLMIIADHTLETAPEQRDLFRVLFREADAVPHVLSDVRDRFLTLSYAGFAAWLRGLGLSEIGKAEADAMAVVHFGSLLNYWANDALLGETPLGLSKRRFIEAWIETVLKALPS
jgi:AcrR family transcriptional regulator